VPDIPETMEDYMLRQMKKTVILKDGSTQEALAGIEDEIKQLEAEMKAIDIEL
jgi:hypothetical protein